MPQNVTTFQFKLIGDITLKQFAYVAGGIILGYVFYQLTFIPGLLRLPLAVFSAILGLGLAFLPVEERPLDRWLINFIRSIYSPTQYLWKKSNSVPEALTNLSGTPTPMTQPIPGPFPPPKPISSPVTGIRPFGSAQGKPLPPLPAEAPIGGAKEGPPSPPPPPLKIVPPKPKSDSWSIGGPPIRKPTFRVSPAPAKSVTGERVVFEEKKPEAVAVAAKDPRQIEKMKQGYAQLEKRLTSQMQEMQMEMQKGNLTKERFMQLQQLLTQLLSEKDNMAKEMNMMRRKLDEQNQSEIVRPSIYKTMPQESSSVKIVSPNIARQMGVPQLTTYPNVITGIIKDSGGNLLPDMILTVKDREGLPVRALKTNKIGQFAASTPLSNGTYIIEVEDPKKRYRFQRIEVTLSNPVLPPLEISATSERDMQRAQLSAQIFGKNNI